jgi:hypothetical protein
MLLRKTFNDFDNIVNDATATMVAKSAEPTNNY